MFLIEIGAGLAAGTGNSAPGCHAQDARYQIIERTLAKAPRIVSNIAKLPELLGAPNISDLDFPEAGG
jgi:hypothetical protein